jgi:hypothetical protein
MVMVRAAFGKYQLILLVMLSSGLQWVLFGEQLTRFN